MREIKFRGKTETGEWAYGFVAIWAADNVVILNKRSEVEGVIPETVGQFIGLKDDKGVEIFEGDIVQMDTEDGICIAETIYRENEDEDAWVSGFSFKAKNFKEYEDNEPIGLEIISNIHDNPEIL